MTPYLSADWFRLWKVALTEARRLDMNVWIYDENSFLRGLVPDAMPESRGQGLVFREEKHPGKPGDNAEMPSIAPAATSAGTAGQNIIAA